VLKGFVWSWIATSKKRVFIGIERERDGEDNSKEERGETKQGN